MPTRKSSLSRLLSYTALMWLLKKVHTYAGLLTFVNLAVYGVAGLSVTFLQQSGRAASVISYQNFSIEPNLTDRQVAERVRSQLSLSLETPVNSAATSMTPPTTCCSIS